MVERKAQSIPPDEVDFPFIADFIFNAKKSVMESKGLGIEKIQKILQEHFVDSVFSYIFVCEDEILAGWLLLYKKNDKELIVNPGETLGGFPVINPKANDPEKVANLLLAHTINSVKESSFDKIELVIPATKETQAMRKIVANSEFFLKLTYNDMIREITNAKSPLLPDKYLIKKVDNVSDADLYNCYIKAFENGGAQFFKYQSEDEKKEYFKDLYIEENADTTLSVAIFEENILIGFSYVLEFEPGVKHISCMCVIPEYQGTGVGDYLMNYIIKNSIENGAKAIALGTEPSMVAYNLYKKHGFKDIAFFNIYGWIKDIS